MNHHASGQVIDYGFFFRSLIKSSKHHNYNNSSHNTLCAFRCSTWFIYFFKLTVVWVCNGAGTQCTPKCAWRLEDNLWEWGLSFHAYVHSRDQTQVLCRGHLYHLTDPVALFVPLSLWKRNPRHRLGDVTKIKWLIRGWKLGRVC